MAQRFQWRYQPEGETGQEVFEQQFPTEQDQELMISLN